MRKEIEELINSEEGKLKINDYCTLYRWTKSALGENVDCLEARFNLLYFGSHEYDINARDWRGVVNEVLKAQTEAFANAAATLNKELQNGYFRCGVLENG